VVTLLDELFAKRDSVASRAEEELLVAAP